MLLLSTFCLFEGCCGWCVEEAGCFCLDEEGCGCLDEEGCGCFCLVDKGCCLKDVFFFVEEFISRIPRKSRVEVRLIDEHTLIARVDSVLHGLVGAIVVLIES